MKSSKHDEKDKTTDKQKIAKDNLSYKGKFQTVNLPSNFKSMEIWLRYVWKVVGTHSFILDPTSEATTKFDVGLSQGCYVYRLDSQDQPIY